MHPHSSLPPPGEGREETEGWVPAFARTREGGGNYGWGGVGRGRAVPEPPLRIVHNASFSSKGAGYFHSNDMWERDGFPPPGEQRRVAVFAVQSGRV